MPNADTPLEGAGAHAELLASAAARGADLGHLAGLVHTDREALALALKSLGYSTLGQRLRLQQALLSDAVKHDAVTKAPGGATPSGTYGTIAGVEAVWQLPPHRAAGLLFLAHGCCHGAIDWWPRGPNCERCIGLPEEVRIVRQALQAGWGAIALSSSERVGRRAWDFATDGPRVAAALNSFRTKHSLEQLPLAALGASAGGAFVLQLAGLVPLHAVVSQIMALPPALLRAPPGGACFPPTLFVHMTRDDRTSALVQDCVSSLRARGGAVARREIGPRPVTPAFFKERLPQLSAEHAHALCEALRRDGLLDAQAFLKHDPRSSPWRAAM